MARAPTAEELELIRLVASEIGIDHDDMRLAKFCDDRSTLSAPDTFNRCHDMDWIRSRHDHDSSTSTVYATLAGRAALSQTQGE